MQITILPQFWLAQQAREAVDFYLGLFPESELVKIEESTKPAPHTYRVFQLAIMGLQLRVLEAERAPQPNPAGSFFVYCGNSEALQNTLYEAFTTGGRILMPLGKYNWSSRYALVQDKFGVAWHLDIDPVKTVQKIVPAPIFMPPQAFNLAPAHDFYAGIFPGFVSLMQMPYTPAPDVPHQALLFVQMKWGPLLVNMLSSSINMGYSLNESFAFCIETDSSTTAEHMMEKLAAGGKVMPGGWLTDKFGVSWVVV
jgi:predicted 3-demethylubiquinone-9 3-methyltransferase (glyoxalase superfamily)